MTDNKHTTDSNIGNKKEKFSFSKLDTFNQCPYRFKKRYEERKRGSGRSIALDIGSILHKGKELIGDMLIANKPVDYEYIKSVVLDGFDEIETDKEGKTKTVHLKGIREIQAEYFEDWNTPDNKSGKDYNEKMETYFDHLKDLENQEGWRVAATEREFDFPFRDYILTGIIDRIDENKNGKCRIIDYKSSKSTYDDKKLKTPLQMFIYALAVEQEKGELPIEFIYDFILLDMQQNGCTAGYYERGLRKLNQLFDDIESCRKTGVYKPKPSPLCYWCDYCVNNPNAGSEHKHECPYYSMWTPNNKVYKVNKKFDPKVEEAVSKALDFDF